MWRYPHFLRVPLVVAILVTFLSLASGCHTSTHATGIPSHIRSVEVEIFKNNTMYKGIETRLTRQLIDQINADPVIRVVSGGGDAVLSGEITNINRQTIRETTTDEPATVSVSIHATFSLYDEAGRHFLMADIPVSSSESSTLSGLYEASQGETVSMAEDAATTVLARAIINRSIGSW
ncbi:MAG: LPS assembly lipoprotein LptE [Planctomycetota bacterium]|jgi:hypothetical protein|nr:LPS assembly lipoprotein LptE [Planctomycetota bacterium]